MTEYYDDKKYNLAYERCIGVMAKLVQKYGVQVLEKEEKKEMESFRIGQNTCCFDHENVIHECKNPIAKQS